MHLEFNLSTQFRERQSAPPMREPETKLFRAQTMPDFSRLHEISKVKQSNAELTVPVCFDLVSEKRRLKALDIRTEKQRIADEEELANRKFKAKQLPDFESRQPCIMPSQKRSTVPVMPKFASDLLPKKEKLADVKKSQETRDFVF